MPNHHTTPARARRTVVAALLVFLALVGVACGDDGGDEATAKDGSIQQPADETNLTIWAPQTLKTTLDRIVRRYQQSRPDKQVVVLYESTSELNDRLLQGERPDVYVGTGRQVNTLIDERTLPDATKDLGSDEVQLIVAPGNPKNITDLTVFGLDSTTNVGLCQANAECGKAARSALGTAQINPTPDTTEPDAKTLISKVANGQLDATLLTRTTVAKAIRDGQVSAVVLPSANRTETVYQMVAVRSGGAVDDFIRFVGRNGTVKKVLQNAGLAAPAAAAPSTTQQP